MYPSQVTGMTNYARVEVYVYTQCECTSYRWKQAPRTNNVAAVHIDIRHPKEAVFILRHEALHAVLHQVLKLQFDLFKPFVLLNVDPHRVTHFQEDVLDQLSDRFCIGLQLPWKTAQNALQI